MSEDKRRWSMFPKPLDSLIEPLTRPVFKKQGLAGSRIITDWEQIVGPKLASHSLPEKLSFPAGKKSNGTLTISVENGFATELQHMQHVIIERLASYFGYQAVSRITISHSWVAAPKEQPKTNKPTTPALPKNSAQLTEQVEDPELRQALQSLAKTLSS